MNILKVQNLTKHYGKVKAIDNVSFSIDKGDIYGFLGPNGAGKTTTIRCIMDFVRPKEGNIAIFGKDAQKDSMELKRDIGYLPGKVCLYDSWTGVAHFSFLRKMQGKTDDFADDLSERLDFDPTRKAKALSSGNRQKLGVIMAFMFHPKLFILDEPTNALDPLLQHKVYDLIKEEVSGGATVFMSSHNLAEVEKVCNHVGIIKQGTMVATENISSLKRKKVYTVKASFIDSIDNKVFTRDGIEIIQALPKSIVLRVKGDINEAIKLLHAHRLRDIEIERASLEDIFLEYYKK